MFKIRTIANDNFCDSLYLPNNSKLLINYIIKIHKFRIL